MDGCRPIGEIDGWLDVWVGYLLVGDLLGLWRGLIARKLGLFVVCVVHFIFWWMNVLVRWLVWLDEWVGCLLVGDLHAWPLAWFNRP